MPLHPTLTQATAFLSCYFCVCPFAASPISIELAQQALALRPGTYALVVSTEVVTQSIYKGTQRSMQVANVLFRCDRTAR
jgi:hypothetical protein